MAVERRLADTARFYALLAHIEEKVGGRRCLAECDDGTDWPDRGVYFFFEPGERRSRSGEGDRVTRVGTHTGLTTSLWNRLSQHCDPVSNGPGSHRASVFRGLVGRALTYRGDCELPRTWRWANDDRRTKRGMMTEVAPRFRMTAEQVEASEADLERRVSDYIGRMPLLWLRVPDAGKRGSMRRRRIERQAIALLSGYARPALDPPSTHWLGNHSDREKNRESGLWNSKHVDEPYHPAFLDEMERLIAAW